MIQQQMPTIQLCRAFQEGNVGNVGNVGIATFI